MKKGRNKILFLMCIINALLFVYASGCGRKSDSETLHIAMPYSDNVQNPDGNYYINLLEEKTGYDIEITLIKQSRSEDYLEALFSSDADIDIVMFGEGFKADEKLLDAYRQSGDIYVDGQKGYYTNNGDVVGQGETPVMWINYGWLRNLGLTVPETTEELREVLRAFAEEDPNGNGIKDEIPFLGTDDVYMYSPIEFLMGSFVYNDPYHSRYGTGDEQNVLMAVSDEYREGVAYCRSLYAEGLIDERVYVYTTGEFAEAVNSPADIVGAFVTGSVSDIVYAGNPEVMARYIHVTPLESDLGRGHAMYLDEQPFVGAVIVGRSEKKAEAANLLDMMMTEECSLIARYGEQGVDWEYSDGRDVSIYGGVATIVTKSYIWNTPQNKHLSGIGPMDVPMEQLMGVAWNGTDSDLEYINARATKSYRSYMPEDKTCRERDEVLSEYLDSALKDFVTGEKDIESDEEWERYLREIGY